MAYTNIDLHLKAGEIVILDGGTGTELERRGVSMDPDAWCGTATLQNLDLLAQIHQDYIAAGADIITANTFASSRLMLGPAGVADQFRAINTAAIDAAHRARETSARSGVLVAGSLSHMIPVTQGSDKSDPAQIPNISEMAEAFSELATLHKDNGCDLILLEMMYHPDRMRPAFEAAIATGLPVWAGFSARRGETGEVLGYTSELDVPFAEIVEILADFDVAAAGIMHTAPNIIGEALAILKESFDGPLSAYPDSGYFKMPEWQFENVIPPEALLTYAKGWTADGAQILGGCCGLSPDHIAAISTLRGHKTA